MKKCSTYDVSEKVLQSPSSNNSTVTRSTLTKTVLVWLLGSLLAWKPSLAASMGKFICACWRRFPEA